MPQAVNIRQPTTDGVIDVVVIATAAALFMECWFIGVAFDPVTSNTTAEQNSAEPDIPKVKLRPSVPSATL
jgi:hypothetical protein